MLAISIPILDKNTIIEMSKSALISIIILAIAFVLIKIIMLITSKVIHITRFNKQKERTIKSIIDSFSAYLIFIVAILAILSEFGFIKSSTILTGAGIFTIIAGFGSQNLIKDFINGFFILFERQMRVGDYVVINEKYYGTVEEIGLRATAIREWSLNKIYIPNGEIKTLKNYYKERSKVIIEVIVPFEEEHDRVSEAFEDVCKYINTKYDEYLYKVCDTNYSEFSLLGVVGLKGIEGGAKYILTGVVIPRYRWSVRNRTYECILRVFQDRNIKIGYPIGYHHKHYNH